MSLVHFFLERFSLRFFILVFCFTVSCKLRAENLFYFDAFMDKLDTYSGQEEKYEEGISFFTTVTSKWKLDIHDKCIAQSCLAELYRWNNDKSQALLLIQVGLVWHKNIIKDKNLALASLLMVRGNIYSDQGMFNEAQKDYEKSLSIMLSILDQKHPIIIEMYINLGFVYFNLDKYSDAKTNFELALKIVEEYYEEDESLLSKIYTNLGTVYESLDNFLESENYFQRALKLQGKETENQIYYIYNGLGNLYNRMQKYADMEKCYIYVLNKVDNTTVDAANILNNLGAGYRSEGKFSESESCLLRAKKIYEDNFGENHILLSDTYDNLGGLYSDLGKYDKAEEFALRSLEIRDNELGGESIRTIRSYNNVGYVYMLMGKYEEAEEYLLKAISQLEKNTERNDSAYANVCDSLGDLYQKMSKYTNAEVHYLKVLKYYEQIYGELHPIVKKLNGKIGEMYSKMGRTNEAQRYYAKANSQNQENPSDLMTDKLWQNAMSAKEPLAIAQQYSEMLMAKLSEKQQTDVSSLMRDIQELYANHRDMAEALLQSFDRLEKELHNDDGRLAEYFLFLDQFTESGLGDTFPAQKRNAYFEHLEDKLDAQEGSADNRLTILTLLAANYLKYAGTVADGREMAQEAIDTAMELKQQKTALQLYQKTLRQLLKQKSSSFTELCEKAKGLAATADDAEMSVLFSLQDVLFNYANDRQENIVESVRPLVEKFPESCSRELFFWLTDARKLLGDEKEAAGLLKLVRGTAVAECPAMDQRRIAALLVNAGESDEARRWFGDMESDFERLLFFNAAGQSDNPSVLQEYLSELQAIKPVPFKKGDSRYSADDMRFLQCLTLCKYARTLNDDVLLRKAGEEAEKLAENPQCSQRLVGVLEPELRTVLCDYYCAMGDYETAKNQIEAVLNKCGKEDSNRPYYLQRKGICCLALGENQNAAGAFEEVAKTFQDAGRRFPAATAYRNLACALYRCGEYGKAQEVMRSCNILGWDKDPANPNEKKQFNRQEAESILLADMAVLAGDTEKASRQKQKEFDDMWLRAKILEAPELISDFALASAFFRNEVLRRQKKSDIVADLERHFNYEAALAAEERRYKPAFVWNQEGKARELLLSSLRDLVNEAEDDASRGQWIQKLDFWNKKFEQKRVRSLNVASASADSDDNAETVADMAVLDIIAQFQEAKQIVAIEEQKPEGERDKTLLQSATATLRRLEVLYEVKKQRLAQAKQAKFAELLSDSYVIHPDSLDQLASVLEEGTTCLQFVPMENEILAYLVAHNTPPLLVQIDLGQYQLDGAKLDKQIAKLRNILQGRSMPETKTKSELQKLHNVLFAALAAPLEKLGTKKLLVNSSGKLRYIPFAALYDGQKYLIEKYQVTNVTGLDLIRLSKAQSPRKYADAKLVVFADPDGSLPSGRQEGADVASFFEQKSVFTGEQATLAEFEALAGNVNFVHLATHGVIDSDTPQNSFILFAGDRNWRYCDMMGFNIQNVDSIVLSACNSASKAENLGTGAEIEGMAYQLLRKSPSGSVVASFWKVDDAATSQLMNAYYAHIIAAMKADGHLDRGGALREAQLKLLANHETSLPCYWAAFTLFGDYR